MTRVEWVGGWVILIAVIAAITDFRSRKIFNWLTLPAMAVGLLISFFVAGLPGLLYGLLGMAIALIAFGWMWGIKILGAGDVKLLMAFATLSGASTMTGKSGVTFTADLALLSIMVGGALAFILLVVKGRAGAFFHKFYRFLLTLTDKNLETEFPKADSALKMPFGISIAIAAVWVWFDNPLLKWGMRPWN